MRMSEEKEFKYVNPFDGYGKLKTDSLYTKILFTTDEINKYDLIGQLEQLQRENRQLREKCEKQRYAITENCDLRKEILKLENVLDEIREYINNTEYYTSAIKYLKDSKKKEQENFIEISKPMKNYGHLLKLK